MAKGRISVASLFLAKPLMRIEKFTARGFCANKSYSFKFMVIMANHICIYGGFAAKVENIYISFMACVE